MAGEDTQQALWNFDGAEALTLFEIKKEFIFCMSEWNLEDAFWKLRLLRMELDAKLKRSNKKKGSKLIKELEEQQTEGKKKKYKPKKTEKEYVDDMMEDLENKRKSFNSIEEPDGEKKAKYFKELEKFYMYLCYLMKKHGLYFREGEDMTLAVLRR